MGGEVLLERVRCLLVLLCAEWTDLAACPPGYLCQAASQGLSNGGGLSQPPGAWPPEDYHCAYTCVPWFPYLFLLKRCLSVWMLQESRVIWGRSRGQAKEKSLLPFQPESFPFCDSYILQPAHVNNSHRKFWLLKIHTSTTKERSCSV